MKKKERIHSWSRVSEDEREKKKERLMEQQVREGKNKGWCQSHSCRFS